MLQELFGQLTIHTAAICYALRLGESGGAHLYGFFLMYSSMRFPTPINVSPTNSRAFSS